jgi:hypothetical protein
MAVGLSLYTYSYMTDDIVSLGDKLYIGKEDATGCILVVDKSTNPMTKDSIYTGISNSCYGVFYDGSQVWATMNGSPGGLAKIDPYTGDAAYMLFPAGYNATNELNFEGGRFFTTFYSTNFKIARIGLPKLVKVGSSGSVVSDAAYGAGWDGVTTIAPSKNAIYDKIQSIAPPQYTVTYTEKIQLTPTQLKSLHDTPVLLVSPYVDGVVNVLSVSAVLDYTSGSDYWTNSGSVLQVYCDNATSANGLFKSNMYFYQNHADCMITLDKIAADLGSLGYSQLVQNKAIYINANTNFIPTTTGAYPINIYVTYTLTTL